MSNIESSIVKIKNSLNKVIPYSFPIKIIFGMIITILGGSSFIGLLSELATYKYAFVMGFRLPVEGVPYLRTTVTFISILLLLGSVLSFLVVYSFAKSSGLMFSFPLLVIGKLGKKVTTLSEVNVFEKMKSRSNFVVALISILSSLAVVLALRLTSNSYESLAVSGVTFTVTCITYFSAFRPVLIKYIASAAVLIYMIVMPLLMFKHDAYSEFLNISGFGGGKEIAVFTADKDKVKSIYKGKLLIRTSSYIVISSGNDVIEIPVSNVEKMTYKNEKPYFIDYGLDSL